MKIRLISAAVLLPVLFLTIWVLPKLVMALIVGVLAALAARELLRGTGLFRHKRLELYCMGSAFLVSLWSHFGADSNLGQMGLVLFACLLFWEMMHNHVKVRLEKVCLCLVAGILLPYLLTALVRILDTYTGRYTILIPFLLAFLPDSGAYFVGIRFGEHRLAPVVSPNKTWEGALGGAAAAIFGMLLYTVIMDLAFERVVSYPLALLYGVVGAVLDVFGDLIFSSIKRQTGIKDFGNLIPGHGGVLDRFDSMMTVAPVVEVLLIILPVVK